MVKAIQYVIEKQYNFRAGTYTVGYQSCDDATAQQGGWATEKCTANARAYANDRSVLAVLGTFNSGCAKLEIPILNRAPGGAVAMISRRIPLSGLTRDAPWNDPGEPNIYYPTGVAQLRPRRQHRRLPGTVCGRPAEAHQEASVYILHDNQTFGKGVANAFRSRANKLDIDVKGFEPWDAKAASYEAIGQRIKATGAQSVYLGGIVCNNGVKLIKDLGAVLGKAVTLAGPDGFTPFSATAGAGAAAQGMYISVAGLPISKLGKSGKAFLRAFAKYQGRSVVDPYAVYSAQIAQIMIRGDRQLERLTAVRRSEHDEDESHERHHGHVPIRQQGRHLPEPDDQLLRLVGKEGKYHSLVQSNVGC